MDRYSKMLNNVDKAVLPVGLTAPAWAQWVENYTLVGSAMATTCTLIYVFLRLVSYVGEFIAERDSRLLAKIHKKAGIDRRKPKNERD